MVQQRGILNRKAMSKFIQQFSPSGTLRGTDLGGGNTQFDVNAPVVHLQKSKGVEHGEGRLTFAAGVLYQPRYTVAIGTTVGSGYTVPSDGVYFVTGTIAVSGNAVQPTIYGSVVTVNSIPASGTECFAAGSVAAMVPVHGVVHAVAGRVINAGVRRVLGGTLTTIGQEDMGGVAPAASLTIYKLPSDELAFNV